MSAMVLPIWQLAGISWRILNELGDIPATIPATANLIDRGCGKEVKTRVKLKKNYQNDWVGISEQAISKRLKQLGMIGKEGYWVSHELKPKGDVERRLFACEQLLERQTRKAFLHCIVTEDEKWVHYNNSNPSPSVENHGDCPVVILLRQHLGRMNIHGSKVMLWVCKFGLGIYGRVSMNVESVTSDFTRVHVDGHATGKTTTLMSEVTDSKVIDTRSVSSMTNLISRKLRDRNSHQGIGNMSEWEKNKTSGSSAAQANSEKFKKLQICTLFD
nr:Mariner Mos1 transposase [Hymenolepis microstoma]